MSGDGEERARISAAALWSSVGAGFATLFDSAVVSYTAPPIAETLAASPSEIQWFLSAYSLTFGLGLVPAGRLGDAFGRRNLLIAGLIVFIAGILLSSTAPGVVLLIAGRLVQGLGAGCISAQVLGLIQDHFADGARVRALGAYTAAGAAAAMAGPPLAGAALLLLPETLGWRGVLLLPLPLAAIVIVIAARGLPRAPRRQQYRVALDLPGIAVLGAIVVLITLPAIDPGLPLPVSAAVLSAVIALALALVWWERRYARRGRIPIFAPPLMRARGFLMGNAIASLWFGSLMAAYTALTFYLLQKADIAALALALLLLPAALARFISARLASRTFLRWGAWAATAGIGVEAASLGLLALAALLLHGPALIAAVVVLQIVTGISSGLVEPPLRALTLAHAPAGMNGVAASFLQLTQRLAATFLVALGTGMLLTGGTTAGSLASVLTLSAALTAAAATATLARSFRGTAGD